MAIRGSLREASLADVVQLLALGKKTGCLSVTHRQQFGYIYFDGGRICYASIVNRRDRLGDLLVAQGLVTRAGLDDAIAHQRSHADMRLGEILIARELISRDRLYQSIRVQIEEAVYFLFTWSEGTFNFEADAKPDDQDHLVSINPEALLLEGARRIDEWSLIEKKVPSLDVIFELDRARLEETGVALTPEQAAVASLINARRDVTALVDATGLGEFEVGKALFGLASAGFLRRVTRATPAEPLAAEARVKEHRNLGAAFYRAGMLDEAEREFRRVNELRPGDLHAAFFASLVAARRGRWDEVVAALEPLAVRGDAPAAVHHNLAIAFEKLGRLEDALRALASAVTVPRVDPRTHLALASLAIRAGDLARAEEALLEAAEQWGDRPRPAAWFHAAGLAASLAGDLPRAVRLLADGVVTHPRSAVLLGNLGETLERIGRPTDAMQAVERALREDASLPQLHRTLGDLLAGAGRTEDASASYRRALRLANGEWPETRERLERIERARGATLEDERTVTLRGTT